MQTPSIDQLRRAVKIADQIQKLEKQLAAIWGGSPAPAGKRRGGRRKKAAAPKAKARKRSKLSAAGRAAIVKAQKARWAKIRAEKREK